MPKALKGSRLCGERGLFINFKDEIERRVQLKDSFRKKDH